jgi:hypothetical protein
MISGEIMLATLHRANCDRIDHQPRFKAGLNREQAADFAEHGSHLNSLSTERANGGFEPCTC